MFRRVLIGLTAASFVAAPARAEVPDLPPALIARIADGCRPGMAYGFELGGVYDGGRFLEMKDEVAPFRTMDMNATSRSHRLMSVDLTAWHDEDVGTLDERYAAAQRIVDQLDAAVADRGRFSERVYDEENETIVWTSAGADGSEETTLELSRMGVGVYVTCGAPAVERLGMDELLGRTRVERPVRPDKPLPPRVEAADCADAERAKVLLEAFEEQGGMGVLDVVKAEQEYFEHLTQWYGQQFMDAGVWDEARRDEFQMGLFEDPVLRGIMERQLEGLSPLMDSIMSYMELRVGGDDVAACRAAVAGLDGLRSMGEANATRESRTTALYRAEAERLGVAFEY